MDWLRAERRQVETLGGRADRTTHRIGRVRVMLELPITWGGPYSPARAVAELNDGGLAPAYEGEDYGLYQIYGRHILGDRNALLYIGEATEQTFSARLREHQTWLVQEYPVRIYVGRMYMPQRHSARNNWGRWKSDVLLAERVLIYTYSPHYNSGSITEPPKLDGNGKVVLRHAGERYRLRKRDVAPDDWYW